MRGVMCDAPSIVVPLKIILVSTLPSGCCRSTSKEEGPRHLAQQTAYQPPPRVAGRHPRRTFSLASLMREDCCTSCLV